MIALVLVIAISLGVLAAALIKLAGESGSAAPRTSTPAASLPAAAQPPATTAAAPAPATTAATVAPAAPAATVSVTTTTSTTVTRGQTPAFKLGAASAAGEVGARTTRSAP